MTSDSEGDEGRLDGVVLAVVQLSADRLALNMREPTYLPNGQEWLRSIKRQGCALIAYTQAKSVWVATAAAPVFGFGYVVA